VETNNTVREMSLSAFGSVTSLAVPILRSVHSKYLCLKDRIPAARNASVRYSYLVASGMPGNRRRMLHCVQNTPINSWNSSHNPGIALKIPSSLFLVQWGSKDWKICRLGYGAVSLLEQFQSVLDPIARIKPCAFFKVSGTTRCTTSWCVPKVPRLSNTTV
jgi:hypothetical protein